MKYKTESQVERDYKTYPTKKSFIEVLPISIDEQDLASMSKRSVGKGITWETLKKKLNSFDQSWADGL